MVKEGCVLLELFDREGERYIYSYFNTPLVFSLNQAYEMDPSRLVSIKSMTWTPSGT